MGNTSSNNKNINRGNWVGPLYMVYNVHIQSYKTINKSKNNNSISGDLEVKIDSGPYDTIIWYSSNIYKPLHDRYHCILLFDDRMIGYKVDSGDRLIWCPYHGLDNQYSDDIEMQRI
jgi:hypothetical protein